MAKRVVLDLTPLEARCVYRMCGNIMDYSDAFESMFDTERKRKAAERAYEKMGGRVIRRSERTSSSDRGNA